MKNILKLWFYRAFGKLDNPTQLDWVLIIVMFISLIAVVFVTVIFTIK